MVSGLSGLPSKATPMYGVWTVSLRSFNIFFGSANILEHVGIWFGPLGSIFSTNILCGEVHCRKLWCISPTHFQDVLQCMRTVFLYSIWMMHINAAFIRAQFSLEAFHKMFYADFKSEITAKGVLLRKDAKYWDSKDRSILRTFSLSYLFLVIISNIYLKKKWWPCTYLESTF